MKKKATGFWLALVFLLGMILGFSPSLQSTSYSTPSLGATLSLGVHSVTLPRVDLAWLDAAREATVIVWTPTGHASGVVIRSNDKGSLILTAAHAVNDLPVGSLVWIDIDWHKTPASVQKIDLPNDLALVSSTELTNLRVMPVAQEDIKAGSLCILSGFPSEIRPAIQTIGFYKGDLDLGTIGTLHFVSSGSWPGSSGGPMFNEAGQIVGILVRGYRVAGRESSHKGLAVRGSIVREFLKE
jgi:S1-C subfamily serine protease